MTFKYTKDHEWVKIESGIATVGITEYAQQQLGDVVFVDLPESDDDFSAGDEVCVIESVKAASDIYAPLSGTITETNNALESDPSLINTAPTTDGWIFKMTVSDTSQFDALLDEDAYNALIA